MRAYYISSAIADHVDGDTCVDFRGETFTLKEPCSEDTLYARFTLGEPVYFLEGELYSFWELQKKFNINSTPREFFDI